MNSGNQELIDPRDAEQLTAKIPRQDMKALFYLFTGKPDSRVKTFERAIEIKQQDIVELNQLVVSKLETHDVDAVITNVKVGFEGSQLSEFGTWDEFRSHHFLESERVEEIVLKWDFLVRIRGYAAPQRHTLLFRVARELKPSQVLHMLGAGNHDEIDQVDMMSCPAFCRVDFINAQLSKELINVVSDWYEGRPQPRLIQPFLFGLKKRRNLVALAADQWTLLSWALLLGAGGFYAANKYASGNPSPLAASLALFFAIYSFRPLSKLSGILANRIFRTLADVEGSKVVFNLTSGDKKRITEQQEENAKQGRKFLGASAWNVVLNILATLICMWLFNSSP